MSRPGSSTRPSKTISTRRLRPGSVARYDAVRMREPQSGPLRGTWATRRGTASRRRTRNVVTAQCEAPPRPRARRPRDVTRPDRSREASAPRPARRRRAPRIVREGPYRVERFPATQDRELDPVVQLPAEQLSPEKPRNAAEFGPRPGSHLAQQAVPAASPPTGRGSSARQISASGWRRHPQTHLIVISHDLAVVKSVSDRVAAMHLGKLCEVADRHARHHTSTPLHRSAPRVRPGTALSRTSPHRWSGIAFAARPPSGCRFRTRCPRRANENLASSHLAASPDIASQAMICARVRRTTSAAPTTSTSPAATSSSPRRTPACRRYSRTARTGHSSESGSTGGTSPMPSDSAPGFE